MRVEKIPPQTVAMLGTALAIAAAFGTLSASFAGSAAAQTAEASKGKLETYYLLVFSNPVAGMEDEYNRWYSQQHQKDVVSIPGFITAQRFVASDIQLREGSKPPRKYLVMYKIMTDDLPAVYVEVDRRIAIGNTVMSPAYDRAHAMSVTYRAIRPMIYHPGYQHGDGVTEGDRTTERNQATSPKGEVYYQLVFSDPVEGEEAEYNRWYDAHHEPDVVSAPGFVEAQRLILNETQLPRTQPGLGKYLVMYKVVTNDLAACFADYHRLAPTLQMSPAFDRSEGYTYKALGPMINGDEVRAERGRKKAGN
jgi:hypothetical protein